MPLRLDPGDLLASHPNLADPNFARTLILVCEHSDAGAFGLILNRPTGATIDHLLPDHPVLSKLPFPVLLGGPVDHTRLHFVHSVPGRVTGGTQLRPGLWIGGELDELAAFLAGRLERDEPVDEVRLFVGYAGWGEGQLESELEIGSWIPAAGRDEWIYGSPDEELWRAVVQASLEGGPGAPPAPHEAN